MRLKEEIKQDIETEDISLGQMKDDLNELESNIYDAEENIRELETELEKTEEAQTKLNDTSGSLDVSCEENIGGKDE